MLDFKQSPSQTITLAIIAFLLIAIPATVYLVGSPQNIGKKAQGSSGLVEITPSCQILIDRFQASINTKCQGPKYDAVADVNKDGKILPDDLSTVMSATTKGSNESACQKFLEAKISPCQ